VWEIKKEFYEFAEVWLSFRMEVLSRRDILEVAAGLCSVVRSIVILNVQLVESFFKVRSAQVLRCAV